MWGESIEVLLVGGSTRSEGEGGGVRERAGKGGGGVRERAGRSEGWGGGGGVSRENVSKE